MAEGGEVKAKEDTEIKMAAQQTILRGPWINTNLIIQSSTEVASRAKAKMIQITSDGRVMGTFWETSWLTG